MKLLKKIIFLILFTGIPLFAQWELIWENTTYGLYGVSAPDTMHIWAVGDSGKILHSDDGGDNWFWQQSGIKTDLYSVSFIDSLQGWAAGDSSTIIHTTNGGQTWQIQYLDTSVALSRFYIFPQDSTIWLLGQVYEPSWLGILIKSDNLGNTWNIYCDSSLAYISSNDFHFLTGNIGWVISGAPISFTKDAGITWNIIDYQNFFTGGVDAICFSDTLNGYLALTNYDVGVDYFFIKTNDGGITWEYINDKRIRRINFYNKSIGWAFDFGYDIILTTDDGNTWQDTWQQGVSYITDLTFASKNVSFTSGFYPIYIGQNRGEIHKYRIITGIDKTPDPAIPVSMELNNYPNPFNSVTHITINISKPQLVSVSIYNVQGQLIKEITNNKHLNPGNYKYYWNGTDKKNAEVASGIYIIAVTNNKELKLTKKCLFLK